MAPSLEQLVESFGTRYTQLSALMEVDSWPAAFWLWAHSGGDTFAIQDRLARGIPLTRTDGRLLAAVIAGSLRPKARGGGPGVDKQAQRNRRAEHVLRLFDRVNRAAAAGESWRGGHRRAFRRMAVAGRTIAKACRASRRDSRGLFPRSNTPRKSALEAATRRRHVGLVLGALLGLRGAPAFENGRRPQDSATTKHGGSDNSRRARPTARRIVPGT